MRTKGCVSFFFFFSLISSLIHPFPLSASDNPLGWVDAGLYGGQIFTVACHPDNPDILFAGSYYGDGLFRSTDGGLHWHPVEGFANDAIMGIVFSPGNRSTLWVVTATYVYKSIDGGFQWEFYDPSLTADSYRFYYCLVIDPKDERTVYVGASGLFGDNDGGAVYKTRDSGETWEQTSLSANHNVWSMALNPRNPREVWAVTGPEWVSDGSIYRSRDAGSTWTRIQTGLDDGWFDELVIDPMNPAIVFAGGAQGVIRTTDGGVTWTQLSPGNRCRAFAVDPENPTTVYASWYLEEGGESFFSRSFDSGDTWIHYPVKNLRFLSLALSPRDHQVLYGADANLGVYRSADGGAHWVSCTQGIQANLAFDSLQTAEGLFFVGSQAGVYRRQAGGEWERVLDSPCQALCVSPSSENIIYAGFDWKFGKSTDSGQTWSFGIIPSGDPHSVSTISTDPENHDVLYLGVSYRSGDKGEIYRSGDGGETVSLSASFDVPVNVAKINPAQPENILAGTGLFYAPALTGALYLSPNGGQSWSRIGFEDKVVNTLAFDAANPQVIYVGCGDSGGSFNGLFKSVDNGETWVQKGFGIPEDAAIVDIEVDRENGNVIYAATHRHGIYVSSDGGNYWTLLGLSDYWIYSILLSPASEALRTTQDQDRIQLSSSTLYAGTGAGLFEFTGQGIGMVSGIITDAESGLPVTGATITTNNGGIALSLEGYYCLLAPSGDCAMQAYAQGYDFSSLYGIPVNGGYETAADLSLKPLADLTITKVELAAPQGFQVNAPMTLTASVDSVETPYYQYWVSPDAGGSTSDNWILLQPYTTDNSLAWTPLSEGRYILVVWVTDDPEHHAPQMGGISVTAGLTADSRIASIVANAPASGPQQPDVLLTTSLAGETPAHYYQYSVADNYGYPPEMQTWEVISDYSPDNRGVWTPPIPGYYTTLVEVSTDAGITPPEIAGMTWVIH